MSRAYLKVIESENNLVNDQIFNVGDTNYSVLELANMTKEVIGDDVNLVLSESNDNRSYHISSKKINDILGFKTENTIKDAIFDVQSAIIHKRLINSLSNPIYFNIKTMQNINLI